MTHPAAPQDIPHAFVTAWLARDAAALSDLFAPDADFVNVVGLWWHDRAAIERAHHYGLTTFFANSNLRVGRVKLRMLGPDHATVHARMHLTGQTDQTGQPASPRQTVFVFVVARTDTGWQVVAAQNTDIVPGAETHLAQDTDLSAADYR